MAPTGSITAGHAPALFAKELVKRRDVIDREMVRRGWEIADQQPVWVAELDAVPSDTVKAAQWVHLAAEIDTYRGKYNITDIDTHAVPAKYRASEIGEQLAAKVTAMHKYSELTTKEPAATEQITDEAISAEARSQAHSGHTEAEQVSEALRQSRRSITETTEPSSAERIAAMTQRIRTRTAEQAVRTDQDPAQTKSPLRETGPSPAVSEAQRKIDRLKAQKKEREAQQRRQDEKPKGPSQSRGPTIGH